MIVNSSGQRAEMIGAPELKKEESTYECETCKQKINGIMAFADHLQAHEL